MKPFPTLTSLALLSLALSAASRAETQWSVDSEADWRAAEATSAGMSFADGVARPEQIKGSYQSVLRSFEKKSKAKRIVFQPAPEWLNWQKTDPVGPENLADAPVFLTIGPGNYWMFGRYKSDKENDRFQAKPATLKGFDIPLVTTPFEKQYDAPGGLKPGLGGYHAWQSRDMENWVHHGPVSEKFSRWMTTAEYVDGDVYFYYDFPNDQDPHLYIDSDLTDGEPGENFGMAFNDPSNGSDCAIIRDLDGRFHLIYEDWSPIDARRHSWDSPLAGHAVSDNGKSNFKILPPVVDYRTKPTGVLKTHIHPHWHQEDPDNYPTAPSETQAVAKYELHEPEQDAFGDWAAISIGGQYYLFGDFHHAGKGGRDSMSTAMFTSESLDKPFRFFGNVGQGHPDPDIGFANGKFYLVTQTPSDFVSSGPWVEKVECRVGVDTDKDGEVDQWTGWQEVKESYDYIEGFSKQIARAPAALHLDELPAGFGFRFEFRASSVSGNAAIPAIDSVTLQLD